MPDQHFVQQQVPQDHYLVKQQSSGLALVEMLSVDNKKVTTKMRTLHKAVTIDVMKVLPLPLF